MKNALFILSIAIVIRSNAQIISTVAGNGVSAYSGDGGQATAAELNSPTFISFDVSGNKYIADYLNNRIRKINSTGIITTIAGNGTAGYSGDNIPATTARLTKPFAVIFDLSGNMYISDMYNHRIRKVNNSGIITTIAGNGTIGSIGDGGQATAAEIYCPEGMAFDVAGNLYFADQFNHRIRKINTGGIITTVAGNGTPGYNGDNIQATASELYYPSGVTFDTKGNLYICDYRNNRIRMVNSSGIITTIAGNGTQGFSGDNGQAIIAKLYWPTGIVFDVVGNLYIADQLNNRIRMLNTAGIITTVVGDGVKGFSGDGGQATASELSESIGVAFDATSCNLYISDFANHRIRIVNNNSIATVTVNSPTICTGATATLTASGATNYTWSPATSLNVTTGSTVISDNPTSIMYAVIGTTNLCSKEATAILTVNPLPVLTINSPTICAGDTTNLIANGASSYTWSIGANTSSISANPSTSSSYTVVGISSDNCLSPPTIATINVIPSSPTVNISGSNTICLGQNITLTASGANAYMWSTGATTENVVLYPTITTTYTVTGGAGTCTAQAIAMVTINNPFDFAIPNIVTPNNDGINDFIDFSKYTFSSIQLNIYNRWGTEIFESNDPTCIWKPTTEDDGTYFYTMRYIINCNNETQSKTSKGFITIIR